MKRIHLHVTVKVIDPSIGFYSTLFGAEPVVVRDDYAKWMLDDPKLNFAISTRAATPGVDHVGIQVETGDELAELAGRLKAAGQVTLDQEATTCCYARSDKTWVNDPSGLAWETFFTFGEATQYGEDRDPAPGRPASACCAPKAP
jgi:catechol 2,3-dioxygenase-like lactoylglutathione lyase family enzyme